MVDVFAGHATENGKESEMEELNRVQKTNELGSERA